MVAALVAALAGGCGEDEPRSADQPTDVTEVPEPADGPLPFDLGPGIVRGGDDVVADGIDVPLDRFRDAIADPPVAPTATAYRLVASAAQEERVREAAATLLGVEVDEVDIHFEGAWFEFHAEGHGHDDGPSETTLPSGSGGSRIDEDGASALTSGFLTVAGLRPAGELTPFETGGHLSVEASIGLVPATPVLRAVASVTFGPDGAVIGGYGPFGDAVDGREVAVVDAPTAMRRLALTQALSGFPTTVAPPADRRPVVLVSAELVLSLREALDEHGMPTGERWLVPVYRFVDDAGEEWEVVAVAADDLSI